MKKTGNLLVFFYFIKLVFDMQKRYISFKTFYKYAVVEFCTIIFEDKFL